MRYENLVVKLVSIYSARSLALDVDYGANLLYLYVP